MPNIWLFEPKPQRQYSKFRRKEGERGEGGHCAHSRENRWGNTGPQWQLKGWFGVWGPGQNTILPWNLYSLRPISSPTSTCHLPPFLSVPHRGPHLTVHPGRTQKMTMRDIICLKPHRGPRTRVLWRLAPSFPSAPAYFLKSPRRPADLVKRHPRPSIEMKRQMSVSSLLNLKNKTYYKGNIHKDIVL